MNAIRQIADGMRFQEPAPLHNGWVVSSHEPISDLLVRFEGEGDVQYAFMVKWDVLPPERETP